MAWLWLVAGPNGSGKTTLLRRGFLQATITGLPLVALSADVITASLVDAGVERLTANLGAANLIDSVLQQTVEQGRSVLVETVLSSAKYLDLVKAAHADGVRVGLLFVTLRDAVDHVLRVRTRVQQGGHAVDTAKIIARRTKSQANLFVFANHTDITLVFDNSEIAYPVLVAGRTNGAWTHHHSGRLPDLDPMFSA